MYVFSLDLDAPSRERDSLASGQRGDNTPGPAGNSTERGPGVAARWRGALAYNRETDGSYSFKITTNDPLGSAKITSYKAFLLKPGTKEETELPLELKDGGMVARYMFPSAGIWSLRIRLSRELDTLEFTERLDVAAPPTPAK
ncbi:MAG TPA: hypothetical protein VEF76_14090 [Patescibacteria group bacterium]|nr:hypothetical protein [Patescibacteria group bacterium]